MARLARCAASSTSTVFTPPPPEETEFLLGELLARYEDAKRDAGTHPLILIGALVLDFLAIHRSPTATGGSPAS